MKIFNILFIVTRLHFKFFFGLVALLLSNSLMAQVRFEIRVQEKKIGLEDAFRVEYVIENAEEVTSFTEPKFTDFDMIQGPVQGSSTSIMNGRVSRYIYVSYVIKAKKTGSFTIPAAIAVVDGKRMRTDPFKVQIVEGSIGRGPVTRVVPRPQRAVPPGWEDNASPTKELYIKEGEDPIKKINENLFVKSECNKYTCYVGEPIVATYKLYTRLLSESKITKRPSLNGFSVYDMMNPESPYPRKEMLNGKEFKMYYIRKAQLYPLRSGEFTLEPVEVENKVELYRRPPAGRRSSNSEINDLFRDFFNETPEGEAELHELSLASKPMTIKVLPLPEENKPVNFSGAVGKFTIRAHLQSTGFETGKSSTLVISIKGNGNLPMITAPQVDWPVSLEAFEPAVKENLNRRKSPIEGEKLFEFAFNPNDTGTTVIPPISLSYFDPETHQYSTIQTDSLVMVVKPGADFGKNLPVAVLPDPVLSSDNFVIQLLMAGAGFLLVGLLLWQLWTRRSKMMQEKTVLARKKAAAAEKIVDPKSFSAPKAANDNKRFGPPSSDDLNAGMKGFSTTHSNKNNTIAAPGTVDVQDTETTDSAPETSNNQEPQTRAGTASATSRATASKKFNFNWSALEMPLSEGNSKEFYKHLSANMWAYFANKFSLSASETNKANLTMKMQGAGVQHDTIEQTLRMFTDCEMALYSPIHSDSDMHALLEKARNLVNTLGG